MAVRPEKAAAVHESREPFFFSDIENFRKQSAGIEKPQACAGCPLAAAPFAVDDFPPQKGRSTDILCVFPHPFWADVQIEEEVDGWKKGSKIPNEALRGPFKSKNWWLYQKILGAAERRVTISTVYATLCRGRGNPAATVTKYCASHYLKHKIAAYQPKVILAFGLASAKAFGFSECMRDLRGTISTYTQPGFSIPIIFTHEPSLYFFSKDEYWLLSTFMLDLEKAISVAINGYKSVNWDELRQKIGFPKTLEEITAAVTPLVDNPAVKVAFDIETTGLDPRAPDAAITAISFAWGERDALAYSLVGATPEVWKITKTFLESSTRKIAHNSKFDIGYLQGKEGIRVQNLMADTMLNQHLHDENRGGAEDSVNIKGEYTLKKLVWDYLWEYGGYENLTGVSKQLRKSGTTEGIDEKELLFYAALDSLVTWLLNRIQQRLLNDQPADMSTEDFRKCKLTPLFELSRTLLPKTVVTLADIENRGISLDMPLLAEMTKTAEGMIVEAEDIFKKCVGSLGLLPEDVNIRSTKDLQDLLFTRLKLPVDKKTDSGLPSTDISSLEALQDKHEVIKAIIHYRKVEKLLKAFLYNWRDAQRGGRVYPSYRLGVAKTGRTSCTNPNVQQVPKEGKMLSGFDLKRLFIPQSGYTMLYADYSQQEVRVLASYCGEGKLLEALQANLDLHSFTASEIFGLDYATVLANKNIEPYKTKRAIAKNVTFSMVYGGTEHTLFERYGVPMGEGEELIKKLFQKFPEIKKYVESSHAMAKRQKYVTSSFNRRRNFPVLRWKTTDARALRQAQNSRIQATASDITIDAVNYLHEQLGKFGGGVLLTVHDSIISETPTSSIVEGLKLYQYAMLQRPMEIYPWLRAPLVIDMAIGKSWGDLTDVKSADPKDWPEVIAQLN